MPKGISTSLNEKFRENASFIELQKGDILVNETLDDPKIYYILAGSCVRFVIAPTGEEKAIMFHTENFIPVIGNIYINSESSIVNYNIKANEQTKLIELNSDFAYEFVKNDPKFPTFIAQRGIEFLSIINQLQNHLIGLTSEEFFQWLMQKYPSIFQRFLSKDIASFMGITSVYLSNLKRKQFRK